MTNYLFFTNTQSYKIDNSLIDAVNNFFQNEINTKYNFNTLQEKGGNSSTDSLESY